MLSRGRLPPDDDAVALWCSYDDWYGLPGLAAYRLLGPDEADEPETTAMFAADRRGSGISDVGVFELTEQDSED